MQQITKFLEDTKFNTLKMEVNNLNKTDKQNLEKKIGDIDKKVLDISISGFMATTILNTKIVKVEKANVSELVKKTDYDAKIKDIEGKCFTSADYHRFRSDILDEK